MNKVYLSLQPVIRQHVQKQIHFTLANIRKKTKDMKTLLLTILFARFINDPL